MKLLIKIQIGVLLWLSVICCNSVKQTKNEVALTPTDAVVLSQLIYKDSVAKVITDNALPYTVVFNPQEVNGNYAIIVQEKNTKRYALIIRGSKIEFSNAGFQNFIIQDFNIFNMRHWPYTDTVKKAYVSNGAFIGFSNLLLLKDITTKLTLKQFIENKVPTNASLLVTGHSLGGNLGYCLASYLKKELKNSIKNNMQLITFGAPAVGNAAFVKDCDEKFPKAERYVIDKDIACMFPDMDKVGALAQQMGLDKALPLATLGIDGVPTTIGLQDVLKTVGAVLENTNVINASNKYTQSQLHLKPLQCKDEALATQSNVEAIFNNIYQFHSIKKYAALMNAPILK